MSVRVNLLPEATKQRGRAAQQLALVLAAVAVLIVALGGVWWWAASQVRQAEDRLATEEAVTAGLRADEAELVAFRDLANRQQQAEDILVASLAGEVSLGGVLQDIAAVMPADAQIDSLSLTMDPDASESPQVVGSLSMTGRSLNSHAPGVEDVLLSLERVATLGGLYLNTSTIQTAQDDEGEAEVDPIATFSVDGVIRSEALTERYLEGFPGGLR